MAAVLLVSFYIGDEKANWQWNLFSWFVGFIVYQITAGMDSIFLGPTLLAVIVSATLSLIGLYLKKNLVV